MNKIRGLNGGVVTLAEMSGDGGFSPRSVPGLLLWLDASTIGQADASAVSAWNDLSGNGYTATQGTADNQPTYKTGILNGRGVVRFGGNDFLASTLPDDTKPVTFFFVATVTDLTANRTIFGASGNGGAQVRLTITTGLIGLVKQGVGNVGASNAGASVNVPIIGAVTYTAATNVAAFYINGAASGTPISALAFDATTSIIGARAGGTEAFVGDMACLLKYNRVLTDAERAAVFAYLNKKWAVFP